MALWDLPKVRKQAKQPVALMGMTKATAERKLSEKIMLKKQLYKQLKKYQRDITKYCLTISERKHEQRADI